MSTALLAARPRHRPGGWSPKELSTLSLWLDAGDATTITGTAGAVTVARWEDKSGNARHVYQNVVTARPTRVTNAQNSRAVVRFNGTSHFLEGGDILDILTGGLSIMAVASTAQTASTPYIVAKYVSGGTGQFFITRRGIYVDLASAADARDTSTTTAFVMAGGVLDRANNITGYRDGASTATSTSGFPNTTSYNSTANFTVGARDNAASRVFLQGDVGEIVISLATWSTDDRQKVEGYLAHRWGLSGSLPADHPYKSAAPVSWTPASLGTLSLWLDADDATTFATETVTNVSQWDDKSGNAYHVSQATGANQPEWVKGTQNGRPGVKFTSTSSHVLNGGDAIDILTGGLSIAVAANPTNGGGLISKNVNTGNANGEWQLARNGIYAQIGGTRTSTLTQTSAAQILVGIVDRTNGVMAGKNGTMNAFAATGFPNTTSYDTAHTLAVGSDNGGGGATITYLNGDIYEIIVSLATWSTDDRQKAEGYLAHKWGLTANLPSDHPYKSVAP